MTRQPIEPDRLRLLVLASTYPRWSGDTEPGFVHELSKRLVEDFDVTVLAPHSPGASLFERMDGVVVRRYRYAPMPMETLVNNGGIVTNLQISSWKFLLVPLFVFFQAWSFWRLLREGRFDVIHAHWLVPQGLIAAVCQSGVPFLVTSHGADLYALRGRILKRVKKFVARKASAMTVVSQAMLKEIREIHAASRAVVLPMGVDTAVRFTPGTEERSRNELLFVGRLVEKKGVSTLIEAMPAIHSSNPGVRLTIVGFGPEEADLKRRVKILGLSDLVDFVGAVPQCDLPSLYRRAALFVAPFIESANGDREGLGLVTVEALACGCPVVVGDIPAVHDVLDGAEYEHLRVPPGDPAALARAVSQVLADPGRAASQASELRRRALDRFDWKSVARRYSDLLKSLAVKGRTFGKERLR